MRLYYFSVFCVAVTWLLLVVGGIVNPMGASLACPDWYFVPTCNGELLPEMKGGVLYEHGHRLLASSVGILTLILSFFVWRRQSLRPSTKWLTIIAIVLVALQGTLGGVTVLLGLSRVISTFHLACAMAFFVLLIEISLRLSPYSPQLFEGRANGFLKGICHTTFAQIILGGALRHWGAGLACGNDWVKCGPAWWPSWGLAQLHMVHRVVGYLLFFMILGGTAMLIKKAKLQNKSIDLMALLPLGLVLLQIALGWITVATIRSVPVVVAHTGVGALLLAAVYVNMRVKR